MGNIREYLRKCIIIILTISLLACSFSGCIKESLNTDKDMGLKIDEYVEAFNKTVKDYQINVGKADYENDIPITEDTVFGYVLSQNYSPQLELCSNMKKDN